MLTAINGTYRDGRIELAEDPGIKGEVAVVITFLEQVPTLEQVPPLEQIPPAPRGKMMTSGMLAVAGRAMSSEDDFKSAEHDASRWSRE